MNKHTSSSTAFADLGWNIENSYSQLPGVLFEDIGPASFPSPELIIVNRRLAKELGLSLTSLSEEDVASLFAGQVLPEGSRPIAQAYAGHQFGGFTMLGDGRAILLGELRTPDGRLFDVQFKGSGQTPYSRRGDGLAALGPMLREYIISEAMHALGIPTTLSLAVVTTGQPVYRETVLQGAVLTRVAASHIRVGTYQYLAAKQDQESLRTLADYTISRHYPELRTSPDRYLGLLQKVIAKQAELISQWQLVGFIHGVMNTDNMAISGETIDYGPCAFMDTYHPQTVFSSIDQGGRYAYHNQPAIGQWNLARFAETLLPLLADDEQRSIEVATEALNEYPKLFEHRWVAGMRRKLGLRSEGEPDRKLVEDLLQWMESAEADFTNTFDDLSTGQLDPKVYGDEKFQAWYRRWQQRLQDDGSSETSVRKEMQSINPAVIPRNHRVEEALAAATQDGDLQVMNRLLDALTSPFARNAESQTYRVPPPAGTRYCTFCGT